MCFACGDKKKNVLLGKMLIVNGYKETMVDGHGAERIAEKVIHFIE